MEEELPTVSVTSVDHADVEELATADADEAELEHADPEVSRLLSHVLGRIRELGLTDFDALVVRPDGDWSVIVDRADA